VSLDHLLLARSAAVALAPGLGRVEVLVGDQLPSSDRALVARAVARDEAGRQHAVVLKQPTIGAAGGIREEAALRLARAQALPGVRTLAADSYAATVHEWGQQPLALAAAFR